MSLATKYELQHILRQTACMIVYLIMVDNFAFVFICTTVSETKCRLPLQFVSEGWRLTINVCNGTHRDPVCVSFFFFFFFFFFFAL